MDVPHPPLWPVLGRAIPQAHTDLTPESGRAAIRSNYINSSVKPASGTAFGYHFGVKTSGYDVRRIEHRG